MQRADEPDIESAPRHWCEICRKRTVHGYRFGYMACLEESEEEEDCDE